MAPRQPVQIPVLLQAEEAAAEATASGQRTWQEINPRK